MLLILINREVAVAGDGHLLPGGEIEKRGRGAPEDPAAGKQPDSGRIQGIEGQELGISIVGPESQLSPEAAAVDGPEDALIGGDHHQLGVDRRDDQVPDQDRGRDPHPGGRIPALPAVEALVETAHRPGVDNLRLGRGELDRQDPVGAGPGLVEDLGPFVSAVSTLEDPVTDGAGQHDPGVEGVHRDMGDHQVGDPSHRAFPGLSPIE